MNKALRIMVNKERISALSLASLTSCALLLAAIAGTSCEFMGIKSKSDSLVFLEDDLEVTIDQTESTLGVFCKNGVFRPQLGDTMWGISRIFFIVSMTLGSISTVLAWTLTVCLPPTNTTWKIVSITAAFTAVLQVPVFLIFESQPCSMFRSQQECSFGIGSFFQISSVILWVAGVVFTQCFETPKWRKDIVAWGTEINMGENGEYVEDDEELGSNFRITNIRPDTNKWGWFSSNQRNSDLKNVTTKSTQEDDEDKTEFVSNVIYASSNKKFTHDDDEDTLDKLALQNSSPIKVTETGNRITIMTNDPNGNNKGNFSYPAYQDEPLMARPLKSKGKVNASSPSRDNKKKSPSKGLAVASEPPKKLNDTNPLIEPAEDKDENGIRKMAKKMKKNSKRRKARRKQRQGYDMLDDDQSTGSFPYVSPPLQININLFDSPDVAPLGTRDEEDLMDDWNALHKATTAGVRSGWMESAGSGEAPVNAGSFDHEINSYHSDPEPVVYSSGDEGTEVTPRSFAELNPRGFTFEGDRDDNSTLSSRSWSAGSSKKRGRKFGRSGRRRRRHSPVGSLKSSGSLMGTTIDEETVQDIREEEGEEDLTNAYELSRTLSAPEPGRKAFDKYGSRGRKQVTKPISSARSAMQPVVRKPLNMLNNHTPENKISPEKAPAYHTVRNQGSVKTMPVRATQRPRSLITHGDVTRRARAQSLSPTKARRPMSVNSREYEDSLSARSKGSTVAQRARELRRQRLLSQSLSTDTSSGQESNPNTSNLLENNISTTSSEQDIINSSTEESILDISDEKEDVDAPDDEFTPVNTSLGEIGSTDEKIATIVTPDFQSKGYYFQEEKFDDEKASIVSPEVPDDESDDGQLKLISLIDNALPVNPSKGLNYSDELGSLASESITSESISSDHSDKYGSALMDELDLQLIEINRPTDVEYGADEMSL